MIELALPKIGYTLNIPVIIDVADVEILALLGLDVPDVINLLGNNITNHLWNRIIINKGALRSEDIWKPNS